MSKGKRDRWNGRHNGPCVRHKTEKRGNIGRLAHSIYIGSDVLDALFLALERVGKLDGGGGDGGGIICVHGHWLNNETHTLAKSKSPWALGFLCALQNGTDGPFTSHQQFSGSSRVSKKVGREYA